MFSFLGLLGISMSFHYTYEFILTINYDFIVIFRSIGFKIQIVAQVAAEWGAGGGVHSNLRVVDEVGFGDV